MADLSTLTLQKQRIDHDVEALFTNAKGRELTDDENKRLEKFERELGSIEKTLREDQSKKAFFTSLSDLTDGLGAGDAGQGDDSRIIVTRSRQHKSLGQQFVESAIGKKLLESKGGRSGSWATDTVELKATLLESGLGASGLPSVQFSEGGTRIPPLPPSVADLIAPGTTTATAIGYMRAGATANPATTVAEGAPKPEGTLPFTAQTDPLRKIACWLPVSDEFLDDVPTLRSYIDAQLLAWIRAMADIQTLTGDGLAPNLTGILNVPGIGALAQAAGATALDTLALAAAKVQTDSGFAADGYVINATDWARLALTKDTSGNYLGGNPFGPPTPPMLWNRPVVPTTAIAAGTALVGNFGLAAQLFTKGGISVMATNSHQDWFVKNLTAIRAEIRAALAVYRPSAFVKVTALVPAPPAP